MKIFLPKDAILFLPFLLATLLLGVSDTSLAAWVVHPDGTLEREVPGQVLGEGSGDDDEDGSDRKREAAEAGAKVRREDEELKTETKDSRKNRTELRLPGGIRLETRMEEGKSRAELRLPGTRIRLENEDGRLKLKIKNDRDDNVEEIEAEDENLLEVTEGKDEGRLKISTLSVSRLLLTKRNLSASTELPLSVDLTTNRLVISTQAGSRVVAVLPDQAVANLWRLGIVDRIAGLSASEILNQATDSALPQRLFDSVELKLDSSGGPIYEIDGSRTRRILGVFPVTLPRRIILSAQTGAVEKINESILARLLSIFSL